MPSTISPTPPTSPARRSPSIHNPKGEKVLEKDFTADDYGGLAGEFALPKGAMLGVYRIQRQRSTTSIGGGSFRVEEYKKPEFEVKVEAPEGAGQLGEKITATIKAKYYFGAPVTHAKVKYKVLRTSYTQHTGIRAARWDWFYGRGYWWFAADYTWYPGFARVGHAAGPCPIWWGRG